MAGLVRVAHPMGDDAAEPEVEYSRPAPPRRRKPVRADVDTLVERPDLGPRAATLVRAGDVIPARIDAFPRRPAPGAAKRSTRRRSKPAGG